MKFISDFLVGFRLLKYELDGPIKRAEESISHLYHRGEFRNLRIEEEVNN